MGHEVLRRGHRGVGGAHAGDLRCGRCRAGSEARTHEEGDEAEGLLDVRDVRTTSRRPTRRITGVDGGSDGCARRPSGARRCTAPAAVAGRSRVPRLSTTNDLIIVASGECATWAISDREENRSATAMKQMDVCPVADSRSRSRDRKHLTCDPASDLLATDLLTNGDRHFSGDGLVHQLTRRHSACSAFSESFPSLL